MSSFHDKYSKYKLKPLLRSNGREPLKYVRRLKSAKYKYKQGYGGVQIPNSKPVDFKSVPSLVRYQLAGIVSQSKSFNQLANTLSRRPDPYKLHYTILRSFSALEFWDKFVKKKKIGQFRAIIAQNIIEGPDYSAWIKEVFQQGFRQYFKGRKTYKCSKGMEHLVTHYDYTPPLFYLILWKETTNDFKEYTMVNSKKLSDDQKEEFSEVLLSILPDNIDYVNPKSLFEIKTTSSTSFDMKPSRHYEESLRQDVSFTHRLTGRRVIAQLGPQNVRDIAVLTLPSFYTVRLLDELFMQILSNIKESALNKNYDLSERIANHFKLSQRKGFVSYYMRDFKKSANTFNLELVRLIRDTLLTKYGKDSQFRYLDAYLNQLYLDIDGKSNFSPKRGFPLGMGNHLYTLTSIVLSMIVESRLHEDISIDMLVGNDDSSIAIFCDPESMLHPQDIELEFIEEDRTVFEDYGMTVNHEKTFSSGYSVFFEEYSHPDFRLKAGRYYAAMGAIRVSSCITEAKALMNSLLLNVSKEIDMTEPLYDVIWYWGYEFFPTEYKYDYTLGGWVTIDPYINRNYSVIKNADRKDLYDLSRAFEGVRRYRATIEFSTTTILKTANNPLLQRFGLEGYIDKLEEYPLFTCSKSELYKYAQRLDGFASDISRYYTKLFKKRIYVKGYSSREALMENYLKEYDNHELDPFVLEDTIFFDEYDTPEDINGLINYKSPLNQLCNLSLFKAGNYKDLDRTTILPIDEGLLIEAIKLKRFYNYKSMFVLKDFMKSEKPYALSNCADNLIADYVNRHWKYPIKYSRSDITKSKKMFDIDAKGLFDYNDYEVVSDLDYYTLWHATSKEEVGHKRVDEVYHQTLFEYQRSPTLKPSGDSKMCNPHAYFHSIHWNNADSYPTPEVTKGCPYCDDLSEGLSIAHSSFDTVYNSLRMEDLIPSTVKSVKDKSLIPISWWKPPNGWKLYVQDVPEKKHKDDDISEDPIDEEEIEYEEEDNPDDYFD